MRSRWPEVTSGSSTSFQARAAHFRLSPDSGHIAASHRSATNRLTARGAAHAMVKRAGAAAGLGIKVHAHMLRHACGFKLANDGIDTRSLQAYLGHSNIQNTARYTALASGRFKNFWRD
jgi:type 1 fimbriae regulatory protein FimE